MKKIIKGLLVFLFIIIISGCTKNYKAITYKDFIDAFQSESKYYVNEKNLILDNEFERHIEASGNNNQFVFYEFDTEESAKEYVASYFKGKKRFKYSDKKKYIIVKSTSAGYFYLVQIDNIVVMGDTSNKSNKKEIKRIFKKLGY